MPELFFGGGADFSVCRRYRYSLYRIWDAGRPLVMFIGLNPSRANEERPDNTIKKVARIAQSNGYGGFYMMNLFAWVTPYPDELKKCADPLGDNDGWIERVAPLCKDVVFAWGNFKETAERAPAMVQMFPEALCLVKNKNGSPMHPLFVRGDTKLIKF